jgi:phage shock protein PspC (stress-responsive transcriptional regulator)
VSALPLRSGDDRLVAGVCGGLADAIGVDAALVRIAFVVAFLFGGFGILVYAALGVLLPARPAADPRPVRGRMTA